MESKAAMRVGAVVVLGLALFGAAWAFFSRDFYKLNNYALKVYYDDTKGLLKQTPVRMSGVTIGEVNSIDISDEPAHRLKPVVRLAINNKYKDRIPDNSTITITTGLLIANTQIDITPGNSATYFAPDAVWP